MSAPRSVPPASRPNRRAGLSRSAAQAAKRALGRGHQDCKLVIGIAGGSRLAAFVGLVAAYPVTVWAGGQPPQARHGHGAGARRRR
jgi:hypothetical protein